MDYTRLIQSNLQSPPIAFISFEFWLLKCFSLDHIALSWTAKRFHPPTFSRTVVWLRFQALLFVHLSGICCFCYFSCSITKGLKSCVDDGFLGAWLLASLSTSFLCASHIWTSLLEKKTCCSIASPLVVQSLSCFPLCAPSHCLSF
jgi:hypothetical protein